MRASHWTSRDSKPHAPRDPANNSDFISRMRAALPRPLEPPVTGSPHTYHDMEQAVKKGSPATSLDELLRPLVSTLPGFGQQVLVGVLQPLASGTTIRFLLAVLHLCLAKRLPTWLVRNSRPSCWSPTSGGWRRALCTIAGSPTESSAAPYPRGTLPIGGNCRARR